MIELISTEAKSKAQQIRDYVAANPNATPTEIAKTMKVNRQYVYTVMWKTKVNAGVKLKKAFPIKKVHRKVTKKLGRPRKVTEASENLKRLVDEYKASKAKGKAEFKNLGVSSSNHSINKPTMTSRVVIDAPKVDPVNHPAHYKVGGIETIDFIEAKKLNYNIGNVVKYLTRADHKGNRKQDLEKALWYLERELSTMS